MTSGNLAAALASYQAALVIIERLAKADPGNAGWQDDLSVSNERVGDVQRDKGDLAAALASYQAALTIRSASPKPTRATQAGRATSPSRTKGSATSSGTRATWRRRLPAIRRR